MGGDGEVVHLPFLLARGDVLIQAPAVMHREPHALGGILHDQAVPGRYDLVVVVVGPAFPALVRDDDRALRLERGHLQVGVQQDLEPRRLAGHGLVVEPLQLDRHPGIQGVLFGDHTDVRLVAHRPHRQLRWNTAGGDEGRQQHARDTFSVIHRGHPTPPIRGSG